MTPFASTDSLVDDYRREVERLTAVWEALKVQLKAAKTGAERKRIRRAQVAVKVGRGQVRQTLAYMLSLDRLRTHDRRLKTEAGDRSFVGLDGEPFWLD